MYPNSPFVFLLAYNVYVEFSFRLFNHLRSNYMCILLPWKFTISLLFLTSYCLPFQIEYSLPLRINVTWVASPGVYHLVVPKILVITSFVPPVHLGTNCHLCDWWIPRSILRQHSFITLHHIHSIKYHSRSTVQNLPQIRKNNNKFHTYFLGKINLRSLQRI